MLPCFDVLEKVIQTAGTSAGCPRLSLNCRKGKEGCSAADWLRARGAYALLRSSNSLQTATYMHSSLLYMMTCRREANDERECSFVAIHPCHRLAASLCSAPCRHDMPAGGGLQIHA